jgi:isoprenylcysteine carboxyl methyltransferase (ICMT) family protein YpbQ
MATTVIAPQKSTQQVYQAEKKVEVKKKASQTVLPFGKENYRLMLIGIALLLLGLVVMSLDKEAFGFGFLGLTLGPVTVMAGFVVEFFAILQTPKKS